MSAGNKEKAPDGGLENSDETEDPSGNSKEGKPELEVEDENENEGRDEKSKDVTESPGATEKENAAVNLMETESKEEFIKLDNLDTKKSTGLESGESNETEINASQEENSEAGSKVEDGKSKNGVDIESQEPRVTQEGKKEESFRFAASVSSIWIPSVVGDQKQKFFLKAGEDKTCSGFLSSNEIFQE